MIYGHMAEVMLSQPATKIFLKTTEPKAAEWVSNAIGKVVIDRIRETRYDALGPGRTSRSTVRSSLSCSTRKSLGWPTSTPS